MTTPTNRDKPPTSDKVIIEKQLCTLTSLRTALQTLEPPPPKDTWPSTIAADLRTLWNRLSPWPPSPSTRILLLGLESTGKTTLLTHFSNSHHTTSPRSTTPIHRRTSPGLLSANMPIRELQCGPALSFQAFETYGGGAPRDFCRAKRALEMVLLNLCQGLVYVVDLGDGDRLVEAVCLLDRLLYIKGGIGERVPVLVLGNKLDKEGETPMLAVGEVEEAVRKYVDLEILNQRPWHVAGADAVTGRGVAEAFGWLFHTLGKECPLKLESKTATETKACVTESKSMEMSECKSLEMSEKRSIDSL